MNRPNILFIIADDLGFSDIGCYGAEISTPHLDALSGDGMRMLNYHTAAACSPTRSMVLTGTDAHLGGLGCLIEYKANPTQGKRWDGRKGYEGYMNKDVAPLSEILQDQGYYTILSGKWHLGMRQEYGPQARGFDKSFAMLPGCSNHYGWEPVLEEESDRPGMPIGGRPVHAEDGVNFKVAPNKTGESDGFYSSDYYADKFIDYLDSPDRKSGQPFFGYLAFSAPHWPLQCPQHVRDKYKGVYMDGPMALRKRRLARLVEMGIIDATTVPHEVVTPDIGEWESFGEYEKQCSSRAMEVYAGMVETMDAAIGRVVDDLKKRGEYDNTMIVFMSDNGAEGAALEAIPVLGTRILEAIGKHFDNSLENIGAWNSFTWLGPLWAQASTAPSRLYKMFPSQGGILVPAIVKPPAKAFTFNFIPGSLNRSFTTCMDLAPTILDMLGVSLPVNGDQPSGKKVTHRGTPAHRMTGHSWLKHFTTPRDPGSAADETWAIYPIDRYVGWELHAQAALRKGPYKIVHLRARYGGLAQGNDDPAGWELFNVELDPGETTDLSTREPERLAELLAHWDEYAEEMGLVWGAGVLEKGFSKEEAPELWDNDFELQGTWMRTAHGVRPSI